MSVGGGFVSDFSQPEGSFRGGNCLAENGGIGNHDFDGIVGSSGPLMEVLDLVRTVAPTDSTVLIEGETGTGKALIAEAVHAQSRRRHQPFMKLNCAAIPAGLCWRVNSSGMKRELLRAPLRAR
jgi:transcriptional regulator with GAF, ATPase, and Fis domain